MKTWTTQAERRLADYLDERAQREGFAGEEAAEFKSDLLCHIHEEAEQDPSDPIGLMTVEGILTRLDSGYRPPANPTPPEPVKRGFWKKFGTGLLWTFGVIFPALVSVFEILSSFCGGVFFDPVPTGWHMVLVLSVPLINGWLMKGGKGLPMRAKGMLAGVALTVSIFYAILFLPLLPLSVIALIAFGMGLLSLMPIFAAFCTWRIGRRMRIDQPAGFIQARRWGVALTILCLLALEGPALWTRINLKMATDEEANPSALARLRAFNSERTLLRACYEGNSGAFMATDVGGWMEQGWRIPLSMFGNDAVRPLDSERTREVFFRVTGKPFNSLKPPHNSRRSGVFGRAVNPVEEFEFDPHVGSDQVAIRLKNLNLAESRFDGHLDADSQIGYSEWTMVFNNTAIDAQEARCQVRLPHDGRVSRLTLWVNGEPREAAFNTVSKVKAAYKAVAVVQRRDPVLVTMCGPDTVMVQCFPVPSRGQMKIRLGITAPIVDGRMELPRIVEQNFSINTGTGHAVWLQGNAAFSLMDGKKAYASQKAEAAQSLSLPMDASQSLQATLAVTMPWLEKPAGPVWCEDKFAKPEGRFLSRQTHWVDRPDAGKTIVVIDGSAALAESKDWIVKCLKNDFPPGEMTLLLADDTARQVSAAELESYRFTGGRDNEPALREAVRLSTQSSDKATIVWLHGPQAIRLSKPEALIQLIERGVSRPVIHELEVVSGPNRLAEAIFSSGVIRRGPTLVKPQQDFAAFLNSFSAKKTLEWEWKRSASSDGLAGRKVWDHLARTWAADTAESGSGDKALSELAAHYQLVTPVSGAVVLETAEQYLTAGLSPVDGDAAPHIPNVPEPSAALLILISSGMALLYRRRHA